MGDDAVHADGRCWRNVWIAGGAFRAKNAVLRVPRGAIQPA